MVEIITVYNSISTLKRKKNLSGYLLFGNWELGIGNWELEIINQ
jgi:hypothetical protein